jgi:flagellin-like hook-associated protein FlgL
MRLPNLNVSSNITNTIRDLDQQRFKLDRQISTGQKITYPEEDGIRAGRLIQSDALKAKLSQYQRNASYASEYLNAGHLNLDHLHKLNQRALEISRVSGSQINQSAAQTYGHEIDQLVEEALNRINATHRGRSLFGGTEHNPNFGNTDVLVGLEHKKLISLENGLVGSNDLDGNRELLASESVVFKINGREYVVEVTKDGLQTSDVVQLVNELINADNGSLDQSPRLPDPSLANFATLGYRAFVRGGEGDNSTRNEHANVRSEISTNGELVVLGAAEQDFHTSVDFLTQWNPNSYFPEQVEQKITEQTRLRYPNKTFEELSDSEKDIIRNEVFKSGSTVFDSNQFQLELDSKVANKYSFEYSERQPPVPAPDPLTGNRPLLSFSDLDQTDQDSVWRETFEDFYNNGNLVYSLTDTDVQNLTGQAGRAGYYSFDFYQDTSDPALPMTGYLKPMEQDADNVWRAESDPLSSDLKISLNSLYDTVNKYGQDVQEINNLSVDNEIIQNRWQPTGAAPEMNWVRSIAVETSVSRGLSEFEISHSVPWKRLQTFEVGTVVEHEGKYWESQIQNNTNHKPTSGSERFWKELPSNYSVEREDWNFEANGSSTKFFHMAPDGQLFEDENEAIDYTFSLLINSSNPPDFPNDKALELVKEIKYGVTDFDITGSTSHALATFDPKTLEYTLSAAKDGGNVIDAPFIKGNVQQHKDGVTPAQNAVFSYEGNYFLITDQQTFDPAELSDLNENNRSNSSTFFLGNQLPLESKELIFEDGDTISGKKGEYIYSRFPDAEGNMVGQYYVALNDFKDQTELTNPNFFVAVDAYATRQGNQWSSAAVYDRGQIVLHQGTYFQSQVDSFNNRIQPLPPADGSDPNIDPVSIIKPSDKFVMNEEGQSVANNLWIPIGEELDYVLKFKTNHQDSPKVSIHPAGTSGKDAKADAIIDADGNVVGLKLLDPGEYYFGASSDGVVPPDFDKATIALDNGRVLEAKIIWEENFVNPGPFQIAGFELIDDGEGPHDANNLPYDGDTFSFATGTKTFLDHRDTDGNLVNVTYQGGNENAVARVGKDTDISFMLDASDGNTASLASVVNSLVDLRDGLFDISASPQASSVLDTEKELIALEDSIIDKIGELSSKMVRMETVRAHDEDYMMALDKQISKDLEIDMSEAIMRLTKVSTAYQAAMQVGAQLLNNSLLNYL